VPTVLKSGSLNLLEPSEPVQACNGIALPFVLDNLGNFICVVAVYVVEDQVSIPDWSTSFVWHNIQTSPETYVATNRMGTVLKPRKGFHERWRDSVQSFLLLFSPQGICSLSTNQGATSK